MQNNLIYILSGSNLGDSVYYLNYAKNRIAEEVGEIIAASSIYESLAWGFESEKAFLNQCLLISTKDTAAVVLEKLLKIETEAGRKRDKKKNYSSRTLDLDILFYNSSVINEKNLTIPHPLLHKRLFTLIPLQEIIAKEFIHPVLLQNIEEMIHSCDDKADFPIKKEAVFKKSINFIR